MYMTPSEKHHACSFAVFTCVCRVTVTYCVKLVEKLHQILLQLKDDLFTLTEEGQRVGSIKQQIHR